MSLLTLALLACCSSDAVGPPAGKYFKITVVDEQTGRGVPLVELQTVNNIRLVTDSNGIIAFHEPGLMDQKVFFHVQSHGYDFPKDDFGYSGTALDVKEGGSAVLKLKRLNIAERLYRVTGAGIYRDSFLVGQPVPTKQPLLNAKVVGSDSVMSAVYRGKIYWFWGDTNRPAHPLGNFEVPGATSELPGKGGLDPRLGINLTYFVDDEGFAKKMTAIPGAGPTWITSLMVLRDDKGQERMFAVYVKVRGQLEIHARGVAEFDDQKLLFERVAEFDVKGPIQPDGHTFLRVEDGVEYVYFAHPFPLIRVRARSEDLVKQGAYQAFTCLKEGSTFDNPQLDRAADGSLRYGWKANTPPLPPKEQARLLKKGLLNPGEALLPLQDSDTGKPVQLNSGSVYWNDYRRRWVLIAVQNFGTSVLGEVWYAEADTPLGPWVYAKKVVTHHKYSFYNPKHHPLFDREGGRWILFEGTYSQTFSGNHEPTPRYDYNQIMYQLDLADARLVLPVPVYDVSSDGLAQHFANKQQLGDRKGVRPVAFFALDRPRPGSVPVYFEPGKQGGLLKVGKSADGKALPAFHALPANLEKPPATATPLYEFVHQESKQRAYSVDANWTRPGFQRQPQGLCLVWKQPLRVSLP
jgi:hypothetical protein